MMNQKTSIRFTTLILLLVCLCTIPAHSKQVTPKKAIAIAKKFVSLNRKQIKLTRAASSNTPYYIYNDQHGQGFVVVAGDDNMGEVLAYSHKGSLNEHTANPEVKYLLSAYKQTYQQLKKDISLTTLATAVKGGKKTIGPIMNTHWNQFYPYNMYTHTMPTGCVATAMAQIMFHHKWPAQGVGKNSYTNYSDKREISYDFSKSEYKWYKMLESYGTNTDNNKEACEAVGLLMRDIGCAFNMQYSSNGSGAYSPTTAKAMKEHFQYSTSLINKTDVGPAAFIDVMRKEIEKGFPIYISGNPSSGSVGHAWVVEGVDKNNFFYMNFGWGGQADGWFSINALNLKNSGREFSGRPLTFSRQLHIVLVHPNKEGVIPIEDDWADYAPLLVCKLETTFNIIGKTPRKLNEPFTVSYAQFTNDSQKLFKGDIGVGLYNEEGKLIKAFHSQYYDKGGFTFNWGKYNSNSLQSGQLVDKDQTFNLTLNSLSNGRYYLYPICSTTDDNLKHGRWCKMKRAPRMAFNVTNGNLYFYEIPNDNAPFQLTEHPFVTKTLKQGRLGNLQLDIRKLTGRPFDGIVKVKLTPKNNQKEITAQTKLPVDFEMFATTTVNIPILIPQDATIGEYQLTVEIKNKNLPNITTTVGKVHGNEPSHVWIEEGNPLNNIFESISTMVEDNASSSIPTTNIDVSKNTLIKIGVALKLADKVTYNSPLSLYLVDSKTNKRIDIKCEKQTLYFPKTYPLAVLKSGWLKTNELNIINNQIYHLEVIGIIDGKMQNLWNENISQAEISFINAPRNTYPGETTDIKTTTTDCLVNYNSGVLTVQANNIEQVEVFTPNGIKIAEVTNNKQPIIKLHIPQNGLKIVKIQTTQGVIVKKIR